MKHLTLLTALLCLSSCSVVKTIIKAPLILVENAPQDAHAYTDESTQ